MQCRLARINESLLGYLGACQANGQMQARVHLVPWEAAARYIVFFHRHNCLIGFWPMCFNVPNILTSECFFY